MPAAKPIDTSLARPQLYIALAKAMRSIARKMPDGARVEMDSNLPFGKSILEGVPDDLRARLEDVHAGMFVLAEAAPLEKSDGVHEIFRLEAGGGLQNIYLVVQNAIGSLDHVTTHPLHPDAGEYFEGWCVSREQSETLDTSWDEARAERRVVKDGRFPEVIDRGANRLIDIVVEAGGTTRFSCEGHPKGAYLVFSDNVDGTVEAAFRAVGWLMDERSLSGQKVARMPVVETVQERDAFWRATCAGMEEALNLRSLAALGP